MTDKTIPFSVLDLAPIPQGSSAREAFSHSLDLAQLAKNVAIIATGWPSTTIWWVSPAPPRRY